VDVGGRFKETDPPGAIIGADRIAKGDVQEGEIMAAKGFWAGWVAFAGFVMLIIGTLDSLQGLTALIKDEITLAASPRSCSPSADRARSASACLAFAPVRLGLLLEPQPLAELRDEVSHAATLSPFDCFANRSAETLQAL
jgi:hypothetical protein